MQSDFGRSARQQQVLLAIKDLATDPAMIGRVPELAASLSDSVKTDLSLAQVLQLANLARGFSGGQIHQQILAAPKYAELGWSPDHQEQIVIPDWHAVRLQVAQILHVHPDGVSDATADQARQEKATIRVLNGTGEPNLAGLASDYLEWLGLPVVSIGNASASTYSHSEILLRDGSNQATAQVLAAALNASIVSRTDPTLEADVVVIVGRDHPALPSSLVTADSVSTTAASESVDITPTPSPAITIQTTPTGTPDVSSRSTTGSALEVVVPSLIGLPEAVAQQAIVKAGLMTSYVNYQTAGDVINRAYFLSIPPGSVLSQSPAPGSRVPRGTKVVLAVRKP